MKTFLKLPVLIHLGATLLAGVIQPPCRGAAVDLKDLSLPQMLAHYKNGVEFTSRFQTKLAAAFQTRTNGYDFLCDCLRRGTLETDLQEKEKAIHLLGLFRGKEKETIPLLVRCLEGNDQLRTQATFALGAFGTNATEAVPVLLDELRFRNGHAARALMQIAPQNKQAQDLIIDMLDDEKRYRGMRGDIFQAFYIFKPNSERLDAILRRIASKSDDHGAQEARYFLGLPPKNSTPPAEAFALPGDHKPEEIPRLVQDLKANPELYQTVRALAQLGPKAAEQAVPLVIESIEKRRVRYPGNYVGALGEFGDDAKPAVPLLMRLTESDEIIMVHNALSTLGRIPSAAAETKPLLIAFLSDPVERLRLAAANSLIQIDPTEAARVEPIFVDAVNRDFERQGHLILSGLARLGPKGKAAAPRLKEMMLSSSRERFGAAAALMQVDLENATEAFNVITTALNYGGHEERMYAINALGIAGSAGKPALPTLREFAKGTDEGLRVAALIAIQKLEKGN